MKTAWSLIFIHGVSQLALASLLSHKSQLLTARDASQVPLLDPWVKNFAAIGDSYAAGIGAGKVLNGDGDAACSRYNAAFAYTMNQRGYAGIPKFTFLACSGDKSENVLDQIKKIADNSQDLVTVSAGGNDALLSDVLKACVFLPSTQDNCNNKLVATETEIHTNLLPNIDDLLQALAPKVTSGGVVVYSLYAQFFNADTDPCDTQTWNWFENVVPGDNGIKLTKDLRKKLNNLVLAANKQILAAIAGQSGSTRPSTLNIAVADWDKAVGESNGRFCEPGSADDPADASNVGLMFQRLNANPGAIQRRSSDDSLPSGDRLNGRDQALQKRIPDGIGKVFHPTILGQELIASTAMMAISQARNKNSKGAAPACLYIPPTADGNTTNTKPECDVDLVSGLPAKVFEPGVYTKFCDAVVKDSAKELRWIVDSTGNQIPPKKAKSKRSPPADPGAYNDYSIALIWSGGDNACGKGCADVFKTMADGPCGRTASEQNIMACSAKSDSGCGPGNFAYEITPSAGSKATCKVGGGTPAVPDKPQPGPLICTPYKKEDIDKCGFKDISSSSLDDALDAFRTIDHGPQDITVVPNRTQVYGRDQNPTYMLNVGYIPGCTKYKTQVIDNPQGTSGDPASVSISYTDIIRGTYKNCTNNKGLGGYQDYGCIRYGFYPTKIKGVFSDNTPKHYELYWDAKNKWCGDG